jgi:polyisoprenoid-binding protein YceI
MFPVSLFLILVSPIWAESCTAKYVISQQLSNVNFSIKKVFFDEQGGFRDYSGEICFDPSHPERSNVRMAVQAASIDTRVEMRNRELRSDDFFDVARYPILSFVSTSVTLKSNDLLEVTGDFTLHGVKRRITVPVHFLGKRQMQGWGEFIGFDVGFVIDRTEFGVNGTRWSGGTVIPRKAVNIHLAIGAVRSEH